MLTLHFFPHHELTQLKYKFKKSKRFRFIFLKFVLKLRELVTRGECVFLDPMFPFMLVLLMTSLNSLVPVLLVFMSLA